jgi:drug/metabolite transporter (DMT)-like permease
MLLPPRRLASRAEFGRKKRISRRDPGRQGGAPTWQGSAMAALLGPFMVLLFCLSQAFRDVYLASIFQELDFFSVIAIAFGLSTLLFGSVTSLRRPGDFATLRRQARIALAMNITTAMAWTCYFFGLEHIEPAIVNTIHSGMAPLTVVTLRACGVTLAQAQRVRRAEYACYAGLALALAGLWWVVLSGRSGFAGADRGSSLLGLVLLLVSGASITISLLYSKQLHDQGVSAAGVTAVRYLLIIAVATAVEIFKGWPAALRAPSSVAVISAAATILIVLPTFALQIGIARTAPLTAQVIRALGPVCVFALQPFDRRLSYSWPSLACIIGYSAFAVAANIAHGWRDTPAGRSAKAAKPALNAD